MKISVLALVLILVFPFTLLAQSDDLPNVGVAVGIGVNQYNPPGSQVQGLGTFFKRISNSNVFFLSTFDVSAVPGTEGQLLGKFPHLMFQFRPGLAIPFVSINNKLILMGLGEIGLANYGTENGITTQGSFAAGGMAIYRVKPNWGIFGAMRVLKSGSLDAQYLPEIGFVLGGK